MSPRPWHARTAQDVLTALDTTASGLPEAEAARRLERYGRNRLERVTRRCSVRFPEKRGARLLYRLDAEGRAVESIVYPETPLGECIRDDLGGLEAFSLPPPPRADHWISVPVPLRAHPLGGPDP